jgi:hypothetical protein
MKELGSVSEVVPRRIAPGALGWCARMQRLATRGIGDLYIYKTERKRADENRSQSKVPFRLDDNFICIAAQSVKATFRRIHVVPCPHDAEVMPR